MHVPVGTPYSIAPECLTGSYTVQVGERKRRETE